MENMRNKIKKIFAMCFVMLALAVVYSAPAWAEHPFTLPQLTK